jgi:hypothetical protein
MLPCGKLSFILRAIHVTFLSPLTSGLFGELPGLGGFFRIQYQCAVLLFKHGGAQT